MIAPGADRYDVRPVCYIALAVIVPAYGYHHAVRLQTHGMIQPSADRYNVRPLRYVALIETVTAHGHHSAV